MFQTMESGFVHLMKILFIHFLPTISPVLPVSGVFLGVQKLYFDLFLLQLVHMIMYTFSHTLPEEDLSPGLIAGLSFYVLKDTTFFFLIFGCKMAE